MAQMQANRDDRIELRTTRDEKRLLTAAAAHERLDVTSFIMRAVLPAARDVVELVDAVGQHQRVVIGQRGNAGAELDVACALGNRRDEKFGACDQFVTRRVMLADPGFVIAELVHPLDEFDIAVEREGRVFVERVERCDEGAEAHFLSVHGVSPWLRIPFRRSCAGQSFLRRPLS